MPDWDSNAAALRDFAAMLLPVSLALYAPRNQHLMRYLICLFGILLSLNSTASESIQKSDMLGLRTTVYMVNDLESAKEWYSKAFGVAPYFDEPYYIGFNIAGFELGLMPSEQKQHGSSVISYWGVKDIKASYDKLISMGAKPLSAISEVGGGIKLGVVTDPFGNPLGIIYNPAFKIE